MIGAAGPVIERCTQCSVNVCPCFRDSGARAQFLVILILIFLVIWCWVVHQKEEVDDGE